MKETPKECSEDPNGSCPFNFFSEESNQAQNYGCLPTPLDIVHMRVEHNKTWECHSMAGKPCLGGINYLKTKKLPHAVVDKKLLTLDEAWNLFCKPK